MSLPGFLLGLVPDRFTPPGGTIILSEGHSSQLRNASPRESHTLLLVLLACGALGSHTGLSGSCRWSSRFKMDGKKHGLRKKHRLSGGENRSSELQTVGNGDPLNFQSYCYKAVRTRRHFDGKTFCCQGI